MLNLNSRWRKKTKTLREMESAKKLNSNSGSNSRLRQMRGKMRLLHASVEGTLVPNSHCANRDCLGLVLVSCAVVEMPAYWNGTYFGTTTPSMRGRVDRSKGVQTRPDITTLCTACSQVLWRC